MEELFENIEIDSGIINLIDLDYALKYGIIPYEINREEQILYVYCDTEESKDELQFLLEIDIEFKLISKSVIEKLLSRYYRTSNSNIKKLNNFTHTEDNLYNLIEEAKLLNASDIHIEIYDTLNRIRFRIDGQLIERYVISKENYPSLINKIKIQANLDISEKRLPQDGRIVFEKKGIKFDIRVSILPTMNGEKVVLRLLAKDTTYLSLSQLGFSKEELIQFMESIKRPHGIILISGPTGSGKTTTLYATLKELNIINKNILTIEDPIEYTLEGVNQVQVKENIDFTFASALRTFLRQDPDIIMLGEIRDSETAKMAIRASLTGHLVLSTIHTNSAIGTISRLVDMGIESFLIADTLNLSVAQRLIRIICQSCKTLQPFNLSNYQIRDSRLENCKHQYIGKGCDDCFNTGFKGRKAIYEILPLSKDVIELIKLDNFSKLKDYIKEDLKGHAISLFIDGLTTFEEIYPLILAK